jgi:hypothetical protein
MIVKGCYLERSQWEGEEERREQWEVNMIEIHYINV